MKVNRNKDSRKNERAARELSRSTYQKRNINRTSSQAQSRKVQKEVVVGRRFIKHTDFNKKRPDYHTG